MQHTFEQLLKSSRLCCSYLPSPIPSCVFAFPLHSLTRVIRPWPVAFGVSSHICPLLRQHQHHITTATGGPPFQPWGKPGVVKDSAKSVFVRNLPFEATYEDVAGFFSQAGEVSSVIDTCCLCCVCVHAGVSCLCVHAGGRWRVCNAVDNLAVAYRALSHFATTPSHFVTYFVTHLFCLFPTQVQDIRQAHSVLVTHVPAPLHLRTLSH